MSETDPLSGCWTVCERHTTNRDPWCAACVRASMLAYGRKVARECAEIAEKFNGQERSVLAVYGKPPLALEKPLRVAESAFQIRRRFGIEEGE